MGYPLGAGPEGGRFGGHFGAYGGPVAGAELGAGPQFPTILAVQGKREGARIVATIGTPGHGRGWLVQRITVSCSGAAVAYVYVEGRKAEHLVSGTPAGAFDEWDGARLMPIPSLRQMYVVWEGAGLSTATAWARVEYWEVST